MNYHEILKIASKQICGLKGQVLDVLDIKKPASPEYAKHLSKVVSKISPLIGNMIEYRIIEVLNQVDWKQEGEWIRQDPGFPDALFKTKTLPNPGIEIKTWFPLATEITARFKDSIDHFTKNQTNVAIVAWLPEYIIYGKPKILDVYVCSGKSLAMARDKHYHNPPDYLVIEPEDTSARTPNLQQTNTNGYKFQGSPKELKQAEVEVKGWGKNGKDFNSGEAYQTRLKTLIGKYNYRLDTNFAKIDRIEHVGLEKFKTNVVEMSVHNKTIRNWQELLGREGNTLQEILKDPI